MPQHEALVNLAFANMAGFRMLCPYDLDALDPETIDEARRNHPTIRNARGEPQASTDYREDAQLPALLDAPLPLRDPRPRTDPRSARRAPQADPGAQRRLGLWLANRVCDFVQIRSHTDGTTVRLQMRSTPRARSNHPTT